MSGIGGDGEGGAVWGGTGTGAVLSGRYLLQEALGGGGFGRVYAASDLELGRQVAVKVLTLRPEWTQSEREERRDRFRREAEAAAALRHPHVAAVHGAGEHLGLPYIVMELLRGTDFRDVLLERGGLPVDEVIGYGAQVAAGLQHAHERGLVHRDIKPENLLLLPGGTVKICDFGLAARRDPGPAGDSGPPGVLGSPPYFSPEQAQGREVTARSDLYSLGCVLYALLAEGPPFAADSYSGYARLHVHEQPERIESRRPDVPAELARLVHRMLAKDPGDRPASAAEVVRLLRAIPGGAAPRRTAPPLDDGARQRLWTLLEEGEALLAAGRFADADQRYWQALQQLARQGARGEPASFAALFGRARALEGRRGAGAALRRLEELAGSAAAELGPAHPLARCVAAYAEVRAGRTR